jgi:alkylation response protein AidB-like acyl-CoA dehydrogenase
MTDAELAERARALLTACDPATVDRATFRGAQFDAGLGWVHFPEGLGGLGLARGKQAVVDEVLATAAVVHHDLHVNPIGIGMGAPTLLATGSREQHERHLRPIFTGEDIWCQLFSEPSSGSDVASIPSRAVRDGDEWVVNGQKVWTTLAHVSSYGMLLTRTDPDVPKHGGLSYFIIDMRAPGVDVRPLFQITGEAEFNEVFLTDVRIPHADMLGAEGEGWRVATTTLMNERVALGGGAGARGRGPIRSLLNIWESVRDDLDPAARQAGADRVARLWERAEVLRLTNQRARQGARTGTPGPEGSVGKLLSALLNQDIATAALDLLGPRGMLHEEGYPMARVDAASANGSTSSKFLRARANTIEGGTSEIMRNILGERILGLPTEPRVDKDLPWSKAPR